jgi:hypothetical protein
MFYGIEWERKDKGAGIDESETGWDSQMICYPPMFLNIMVKNTCVTMATVTARAA